MARPNDVQRTSEGGTLYVQRTFPRRLQDTIGMSPGRQDMSDRDVPSASKGHPCVVWVPSKQGTLNKCFETLISCDFYQCSFCIILYTCF